MFFLKIQEPFLITEMTEVVLIKTPSSISLKLFATNVTQQIWILFDILVPENRK